MKVVQIVPALIRGDAVGNHVMAILSALQLAGIESAVYADGIDKRLPKQQYLHSVFKMPNLQPEDVLIYHYAAYSDLVGVVMQQNCKKVMIYHNITPHEYFEPYSRLSAKICKDARTQLAAIHDVFDYVIADSGYNKQELVDLHYTCPIAVVPILIPFEDYAKPCGKLVKRMFDDGVTNIMFLGRVVPNKKYEDLLASFYYYNKYYNEKSRLIMVGDYAGMPTYYTRLVEYMHRLGLKEDDVLFTGKIPFADILAYYQVADVFLCLSEHEGFCVPLAECMYFNVPILARDSTALPETLSGAGVVLPKFASHQLTAAAINQLVDNQNLRGEVIAKQQRRLQDFAYDVVIKQLFACFEEVFALPAPAVKVNA